MRAVGEDPVDVEHHQADRRGRGLSGKDPLDGGDVGGAIDGARDDLHRHRRDVQAEGERPQLLQPFAALQRGRRGGDEAAEGVGR